VCLLLQCACIRYFIPGTSLGKGITDVIIVPQLRIENVSVGAIPTVDSAITLMLTYDHINITCIKLPAKLLHKPATYNSDIYETLWTLKQQSLTGNDSSSSNSIRLLAITANRTNSTITSWCVAAVKHGSNDVEIAQVNSDKSIKQLACIKGPATTDSTNAMCYSATEQQHDSATSCGVQA
jgi:hypothetical protein